MKRRNTGQVLVLFVLALVVLIGMAALGVDVGYMYSVRHDLQRCADTGALAGASRFINGPGETGTWADAAVQAEATARAIDFATRDNVVRTTLDPSNGNDNVIVTFDQGEGRIKVQTERTVPLFFARLFLGPTKRITAYAVAEAYSISSNAGCIVPWGIPLPWNDNNNNGAYDDGEQVSWPPPEDDCGLITPTVWSYTTHDNVGTRSDRDMQLCQGSLQTLKIGEPSEKLVPGNFFGLNFADIADCPEYKDGFADNGAAFYSYMIKNSCKCTLKVNLDDEIPVETKPGNMVNKTLNPVAPTTYWQPDHYIPHKPDSDSLMNMDPSAHWDYSLNGPVSDDYPNIWLSPRVVRIPVYYPDPNYENGDYTPDEGRSTFKPIRFVGFFVEDIQRKVSGPSETNTIVGRFMTVGGPGLGEGPNPDNTGPEDLNIRLVK